MRYVLLLLPVLPQSFTCLFHKLQCEVGTSTKWQADSSDRALPSSSHFHDDKAECVTVALIAYSRLPALVHHQCVFIDRKIRNVTRIRSKQVKLLYPNTEYQHTYILLYSFFYMIPRRRKCRRFGTFCSIFIGLLVHTTFEDGTYSVLRNFEIQNSEAGESPTSHKNSQHCERLK
jgi:hypothetical protein